MCSLTLCTRLVDDPAEWWEETNEMPDEVGAWLDTHEKSMPLGGTISTKTDADRINSYREALALMQAFHSSFPDLADRFLILREWWCHGSEIEQVYRNDAELLAEIERLEARKGLSSLWTTPAPQIGSVRRASVRTETRTPMVVEGDDS
jgi:hypothetical protein